MGSFALRFRRCAALLALAAWSSSPSAAAQVIVVDASGSGDVLDIQAGIDAALPGGTLLVRPGSYAGFTAQAKSVFIAAEAGAIVTGAVSIADLAAGETLLVAGLDVRARTDGSAVLAVTDCLGHVRAAQCSVTGIGPVYDFDREGTVAVSRSQAVVLAACTVRGAHGAEAFVYGYAGAAGVVLDDSIAALHDCDVRGGTGGYSVKGMFCGKGGPGGTGARILGRSFVFISGSTVGGGAGGDSECGAPGEPGLGLFVESSARARTLGNAFPGGVLGDSGVIPGTARKIAFPALAPGGARLDLEVRGVAGDRVWLMSAPDTAFHYLEAAITGVLEVAPPLQGARQVGVVPSGGALTLELPLAKVDTTAGARGMYLQAVLVGAAGERVASGGLPVRVLSGQFFDCNENSAPDPDDIASGASSDCDSNGIPDECDVAGGTATDCDLDGVLDECQIATGTSPDCNENGLPDACDLASGEGFDCDANGVLDACQLGAPFRFDSDYLSPIGFDDPQSVLLPAPPLATGDVRFAFECAADLGDQNERILLRVNSVQVGAVFSAGASDCPLFPDSAELVIDAALFNAAVAGGDALVRMLPSSTVDSDECSSPASYIQVSISYPTATSADCNANGIPDRCDIASGTSMDADGDGVPDECDP